MPNTRGPQAGPPPVGRDDGRSERAVVIAATNYQTIVDTLKRDRGAEAKAIQAMFGGDKGLMERFLAVCFSSLAGNNDLLLNADPMSIVQAVKDAASLGLEPTGLGGEGAIIRYKDKATFQPMWRGYLKRIRNSGKVVDVDVQIVYMNDDFYVELGTDPRIHHVPKLFGERNDDGSYIEERGEYKGVYAWALMPSGKYIIEYLPTAEINQIRDQFSQAWRSDKTASPWATSWGEMARKTVIRRLAKRLPGEAVDQLLVIEGRADVAEAAGAQPSVAVSRAQRLALAAVNGEQAQQGTEPEPDGQQGGSETEPPSNPAYTGELEGVTCDAQSPFDPEQACILNAGHPNNHRGSDRTSWS